jgi:hypothetical protein
MRHPVSPPHVADLLFNLIALVPTKPFAFLSCSALLCFCGSWQLRKYFGFLAGVPQIQSLQGQMSPNILHFLSRCKAHFHAANTRLVFSATVGSTALHSVETSSPA